MVDYDLLEVQRDTLRELEAKLRPAEGPGAFFSDEEADAVLGMVKLASWMLDYREEQAETRNIAAMIRGAAYDAEHPTTAPKIDRSWNGLPILVVTEQERRAMARALELAEIVGDALSEQSDEPIDRSTLRQLIDKVGVVV